jgi:hypothetical protein
MIVSFIDTARCKPFRSLVYYIHRLGSQTLSLEVLIRRPPKNSAEHIYSSSFFTPAIDTNSDSKTIAVSLLFSATCTQLTQDAVGRDRTSTPRAIRPLGLDGELPLLARAHVEQTLVPALDNLTRAHGEGQGLAAVV